MHFHCKDSFSSKWTVTLKRFSVWVYVNSAGHFSKLAPHWLQGLPAAHAKLDPGFFVTWCHGACTCHVTYQGRCRKCFDGSKEIVVSMPCNPRTKSRIWKKGGKENIYDNALISSILLRMLRCVVLNAPWDYQSLIVITRELYQRRAHSNSNENVKNSKGLISKTTILQHVFW